MENEFFSKPILNSPYEYPSRHWELDDKGQPTQQIIEQRRGAEFITPIPKPKKRKGSGDQLQLFAFEEDDQISSAEQRYDPTPIINELRKNVDTWRKLPHTNDWLVTPDTARLLQHWRHHPFNGVRPFFCQIEAVETAIWLTEVAPKMGKVGSKFLTHLEAANQNANPELMRLALKLATGAGKTTVMAMIIAWQTVNAVRRPNSKNFSRGFLIVTPGITIRDRLRVLQPNDPDSYYQSREIVPSDMLGDIERAKIVITNFHAFKLRERLELSKGGRLLQVKVNGVDVFHPNTGEVRSDGAEGIACWFIDTDYNEESFFVRHAYFLGANDPYKALKTTLKAEINEEAWSTLNSDISRPFNKPKSGRIAVKVINHLGDEVMKVFRI
jgi:type III restriction enzyme